MEMKKIDRRINYKIVIDTETCPCDRTIEDVKPYNMLVYDIGWAIVDKRGNVYGSNSFVNADIFLDEKSLMKSAYYYDKVPKYWEEIKSGQRKLAKFDTIRRAFLKDVATYGVTEVYAHNMRFDLGSLNNTQRWLSKSKYRYFFPYNMEICDTLKMARDIFKDKPSYRAFCEKHGLLTKQNRPKMSAEALYAYISNTPDFVESHTGLEDVMIEKEIMAYCYRQHKSMRRLLYD